MLRVWSRPSNGNRKAFRSPPPPLGSRATRSRSSGEPPSSAHRHRANRPRSPPRRPRPGVGAQPQAPPARARRLRHRTAERAVRRAGAGAAPGSGERAGPHDPFPEHGGPQLRTSLRGPAGDLPIRRADRDPPPGPARWDGGAARGLGRRRDGAGRSAGLVGGGGRGCRRTDRGHPDRRAREPEGAADPGGSPDDPGTERRLRPGIPRRIATARGATG